jgi:hypothetical protein
MKEKIIKQIVESLGDGTGGKMDYRIWYFRGEWWIICEPIGSAEPVHDWLNRELDWQYLNECIERATPALSIDVPSEEEIEEFIISHPDNTGNFILGAGISAGFKVGAKWAMNEILNMIRNGNLSL